VQVLQLPQELVCERPRVQAAVLQERQMLQLGQG
jgi:hypothetical protein